MVSIKKDVDVTVLVLAFFILSFFVFLFMKPDITGMVSLTAPTIGSIYTGTSLNNTQLLSLVFSPGDSQPCSSSTLELNISNSGGLQLYFSSITLQQFIAGTTPASSCLSDSYTASSAITLNTPITVFSGLGSVSFTNAGTYNLVLNFSNVTGLIEMKTSTFTVIAPPSDVAKPQITSVNFKNSNGSTSFMITQDINCSATVSDSDSASVSVNYFMYGSNVTKTSITTPGKTGSMSCTGTDWVSGKVCSVSDDVTISDLGYWNCTVEANDGTNKNYANSSVMLMLNSPPKLRKNFENLTINKNTNNSDLDLDSYFEDPDDQELNYSYSGNTNINVSIKTNGDVLLLPKLDWVGNETITFKARDEKGVEVSGNAIISVITANLTNCTSVWNCTAWSACINNVQTRTCVDLSNCSYATSYQPTSQACTSIVPTCGPGDGCMMDCIGGDRDCTCSLQKGNICGTSQNCSSPIIHSGTGVCCSTPCVSIITSNKKAGSGTFLGVDTSSIIIGFSTIVGIVFIAILVIVLNSYIKKKKAPMIEEKPITQQQIETKNLDSTPVKIKPTNLDKMRDYIHQSMANKVPIRIVKAELEKVGWTESDIDKELNLARLKNYIQIKLNQGIPRNEVEQSLKMKGWTKEQIEEASKDTKVRPLI